MVLKHNPARNPQNRPCDEGVPGPDLAEDQEKELFSDLEMMHEKLAVCMNSDSNSGWHLVWSKKNIQCYKKHEEGEATMVLKANTSMKAYPEEIRQVLRNEDCRATYQHGFLESKYVKRYSPNCAIVWTRHKAPWPLQKRDFVIARESRFLDDGSISCIGISVNPELGHELFPSKGKDVRGKQYGGYFLKPVETDDGSPLTEVYFLMHVDPMLPGLSWVLNLMTQEPLHMTAVRDFSEDLRIHNDSLGVVPVPGEAPC